MSFNRVDSVLEDTQIIRRDKFLVSVHRIVLVEAPDEDDARKQVERAVSRHPEKLVIEIEKTNTKDIWFL
jgi:hypothetical protein